MDINEVFQLLNFRASKSASSGAITSKDFNIVFPAAGIRYFNKLYGNQNKYQYNNPIAPISYPGTIKVSTSLSKFGTTPRIISVDSSGRWYKPSGSTDFYIDSLSHFVTGTGGTSIGGYTVAIGLGYTNGLYPDTLLTGGTGAGARANIEVAGTKVTVTGLTSIGEGYTVGDVLTTDAIPGGTGFTLTITSLIQNEPTPIARVEKQDFSANLYSYYQAPTDEFPIYVEYKDYIQFYPTSLSSAQLITLRKPVTPVWGSIVTGTIDLTNTLAPGTGYTNGVYPNILLTGGTGNSAIGTITVGGGVVTDVKIIRGGYGFKVGDTLTGAIGAGTGWSFKVATIKDGREAYDSSTSVDPEFSDTDIDEIIYMTLADCGIFLKDSELEAFSTVNSAKGGIA